MTTKRIEYKGYRIEQDTTWTKDVPTYFSIHKNDRGLEYGLLTEKAAKSRIDTMCWLQGV